MAERKDSGESLFRGSWFAATLFLVLVLVVWVAFYALYGESGKLDAAETTVVALILALLVFVGRWLILRRKRTPNRDAGGGTK